METKIINGDCLEVLKELPENSVDSIVTDPPYGLSFMGKKWDYDVPSKEIWIEALRVLKPGGHLLSFAGSRTYHRMAVNIEDAGFEIRDQIMWVYGSGFPKSHNISKALNKVDGVEFKSKPASGVGFMNNNDDGYNATLNQLEQIGESSESAKKYEGWGTALKPAHEPIVVARKPLSEKTIAENVLKWGTGGINIDGCRVGTEDTRGKTSGAIEGSGWGTKGGAIAGSELGRFPANFIHDGSEEVVGLFPDTKKGSDKKRNRKTIGSFGMPNDTTPEYADSGSASRFFYCAKSSKRDRNEGCEDLITSENGIERKGNIHATVKPTSLMQYLVRLVTPKGGTVLDPFMGSGSTGKACKLEGFNFIGIELDSDYCKIAEARIKNSLSQDSLF